MPLHEAYSAMSVEPTDNGRSMVIMGLGLSCEVRSLWMVIGPDHNENDDE